MSILPKTLQNIQPDLVILENNLKRMVGAKHPILYAAAEHLFKAGGKRIRPTIILLVALSTTKMLHILPEHKRLAEITEIIHTASLVHDDVIDECEIRRGVNTVHNAFSTKVAVLAGDFLFAQSSWYLANLNNLEVVKTISKVITDFAEGEIRQGLTCFDETISMNNYIEKSFYKTASLIASSCKATAILSNTTKDTQNQFYLYGKHLGLAFQIVDDILDIIGSAVSLGKPAGSDLKNGNLTAPLLFALQENSGLYELITREFQQNKDIDKAIKIIKSSSGIQKSYDLAQEHMQASIQALKKIDNQLAQKNLTYINNYVMKRLS
uniref:Prenyl transferase n=1 Tax=Agarophyton chilense TaxID=2510777 RepID=A0A141SEG6_AGACH|nr:prenyl transferase [Agarophyton chilense]AMK96684.1 prenyl transferase [Agarophyton chilense]ASP44579.1 prenyl transferase [Agarophyton chilense]UAD84387.1 prenyl transferase [Agarophyton chilense]